ncbi:UNVERIFIED_CONTAM: Lupeol synthase [Sesamum calycinum]|uniref:Lupeol synthase n=1 Tax=Sesamum calycinum TaxID=2727403 RepID=A0AAW2NUI5_9LAMI
MWRLKIAEGGGAWLTTTNDHIGRQHWEFDAEAGTPEERAEVERMREEFNKNRFRFKQSADLFMRMQVLRKENGCGPMIPAAIKVQGVEEITEDAILTTLRRGISYYSSMQAHDGHWPAESAGPLFSVPPLHSDYWEKTVKTGQMGRWPALGNGYLTTVVPLPFHHGENFGSLYWECTSGMAVIRCPRVLVAPKILPHSSRNHVVLLSLGIYANVILVWKKEDLYYPHPFIQDVLWGFLHYFVEPVLKCWPFSKLRDKALGIAMEHVHYEDKSSRYICIGYVEKVLCLLACWVEDPNSDAYKNHLARLPDFYWVAEDGMKIQAVGSQTWSASLSIQAILSADLAQEYGPTLRKAHDFVKASQVLDNRPGDFHKMYRHICKGAWTFVTRDQGWQVSDCTAEGLKAALLLSQMPPELVGDEMEIERLYDAVNVVLSLQSANGGLSAWEPVRAQRWLEKLNPTELLKTPSSKKSKAFVVQFLGDMIGHVNILLFPLKQACRMHFISNPSSKSFQEVAPDA